MCGGIAGKVEKTFSNVINAIPGGNILGPILLTAIDQPELAAGFSGLDTLGNGGSLGKALLSAGLSYGGAALGGSDTVFGDSLSGALKSGLSDIGNSISGGLGDIGDATGLSGAFDSAKSGLNDLGNDISGLGSDAYSGAKDALNSAYNGSDLQSAFDSGKSALQGLTGAPSTSTAALGEASPITSSYDGVTDTNIGNLGSNIGKGTAASLSSPGFGTSGSASNFSLPDLGTASSLSLPGTNDINNLGSSIGSPNNASSLNAGTALSGGLNNTAGTAANLGGKVASSGLFGSSGSYLSPLASLGIGSLTNSNATQALLKANKQNQALLAPYANGFSFTPGDLTQDPGYQFDLAQGNQALDRKQSASGNYFSGQALKDAESFGSGLADNTYNTAYNRASQGFNTGLTGASAAAGINNEGANTQATSDVNQGNLFSGALGSLLGGNSYTNSGALNGGSGNDVLTQLLKKALGGSTNTGTFSL